MGDFSVINPTLASILSSFKLDIEYVRGEGHYLYDSDGRAYLDFIAQYGAIPFGYNPAFVWEALDQVRTEGIPSFVQPSNPVWAVKLAEKLLSVAPPNLRHVTFSQSGTEAVEAAIKMARSATGKPIIISTENSFHGKTLGSLSATGKDIYQKPFMAPVPGFIRIPFDDLGALSRVLEENEAQVAAFIVEPVQGEGGIRVPSPGYLKSCEEICHRHGVLLIVDEVQTGLGRTGRMFACEEEGVEPDILTVAKALGGGVLPIGACLAADTAWNDDFGHYHSSTFANNNVVCAVASAVIDRLLADNMGLIKEVGEKGEYLLSRCREVAERYPEVVKEVRGKGLMVGFEFSPEVGKDSYDMAFMVVHEGFSALLAGYLLRVHGIRLAPYLNTSMTLRLEPPLTITRGEIDRVVDAVEDICHILKAHDYAALYGYLLDREGKKEIVDYSARIRPLISSPVEREDKPDRRFAFIIHYPAPYDLVKNTVSFEQFSEEELERLMDWYTLNPGAEVVCHMPAVRSKNGELAEGWLIAVTYGAKQMKELPREEIVEVIQEAVDKAHDLGANIVGLGAYTSVVTRGGRDCQGRGVAITSGNSFTIVMGLEALWRGAELMNIDPGQAKGAVVGAAGSIGRLCAILMSEKMSDLVLLGNPQHPTSSKNRMQSLTVDILAHALDRLEKGETSGMAGWLHQLRERLISCEQAALWDQFAYALGNDDAKEIIPLATRACEIAGVNFPITAEVNPDEVLYGCDLIMAVSSSPDYVIYSRHLKPGAVVCDVARPEDVAPEVYEERDDVLILEGGLVSLPDNISFGPNMGYRPGIGLACLSETVLLCLEGDFNDYSIGMKIPLPTVEYLKGLGAKHGFELAALRSQDRELTLEEIQGIRERAMRAKQ